MFDNSPPHCQSIAGHFRIHWKFLQTARNAMLLLLVSGATSQAQSYRQWSLDQGVGHETSNSDSDDDGFSNFLEYAMGTHPQQPSYSAPSIQSHNLTFPKGAAPVAAGNIVWNLELSNTMMPGSWHAVVPDETAQTFIKINLREQAATSGATRIFARLAASRTLHPNAVTYAENTGLSGAPLDEVSHLLYDFEDAGITPDFLLLTGSRYRGRDGSLVRAVIGGEGSISGTILDSERSMIFNGSASWIEFNNPAQNEALADYTLFAVASADSVTDESLVASSYSGGNARGPRLMFNASSSWGTRPGQLSADINTGSASSTSGWASSTRIHAGRQLLPISLSYSAQTVMPKGDLPLPNPVPRVTVSAGVTRSTAAFAPLGNTIWNGAPKFRVGANLTGGAYHKGEISMILITRSPTFEESVFQRMSTAPIRTKVISHYGPKIFAVFDGDSVTEGAGSPSAAYGTYSWTAQLFGGLVDNYAGGQWIGKFNGRNIAVGGRAIASSEAAWDHTTRHILGRAEWDRRYYFGMISHNQANMGSEANLIRLEQLWSKAKKLGAHPVCVGLLSGQNGAAAHQTAYAAVKARAISHKVSFVDTALISQLRAGEFPSGADFFYLDVIHPTEKGYRLITHEIAASLSLPDSSDPRSTQRPVLSGLPVIGLTLNCDGGLWENDPSQVKFQWVRNASDIPGTNSQSYLVTEADRNARISCRVTATNASGGAERTSSHTLSVNSP